MARKAVRGDLLAIPVGDCWALGKVLFVSTEFKDIILLEVYEKLFASLDGITMPKVGDGFLFHFYTSSRGFQKRGWRLVGSAEVSDSELDKTLRRVGNEVWLKDDFVRMASTEDEKKIRTMGVDGFIRIERVLAKHFD